MISFINTHILLCNGHAYGVNYTMHPGLSIEKITSVSDCVSLSPAADLLVQYPHCLLRIVPVLQLSDCLWSSVCHLLPRMFGRC